MFTMNDESRLCWFAQSPLEDELALDEYNMVGRLIGLAIYNGIILDIHFPLALYKKLALAAESQSDSNRLDEHWDLDDLMEIDPVRVIALFICLRLSIYVLVYLFVHLPIYLLVSVCACICLNTCMI
jgi:hypothetical protein